MGVGQCGKWDEGLGQVNRQMLQSRWLLGELGVQRAEGRGQRTEGRKPASKCSPLPFPLLSTGIFCLYPHKH